MLPKTPVCVCLVAQPCSTLCSPWTAGCNSSVYGIFQAKILEWVAISSSGDLAYPGIKSKCLTLAGEFFTTEPPGNPQNPRFEVTFLSLSLWSLRDVLLCLEFFMPSHLPWKMRQMNQTVIRVYRVFQVVEKALFVSILTFSLEVSLLKLSHHVAMQVLCFLPFTSLNFSQVDPSAWKALLLVFFPIYFLLIIN